MTTMMVCHQLFLSLSNLGMGYFIRASGFMYPLISLVGLNILNLLYVIFILEESRDRNRDKKVLTLDHIKTAFRVIFQPTIIGNGWKLGVVLTCSVLTVATNQNEISNLFVMNSPLCWGSVLLGNYKSYSSIISKSYNGSYH